MSLSHHLPYGRKSDFSKVRPVAPRKYLTPFYKITNTSLKNIQRIRDAAIFFQFSNMKSWRMHWDYQLYKALEHQYQLGLQSLHQHLQEIHVELVYR